jgi:P27 family predicted phage terminase small subunit
MTRGRKPRPTNIKIVAGTDRADRRNDFEPKPDLCIPDVPPHLSDEAKVEWGRVCHEAYALGILSNLDRAGLAAYCQAYGRWVQAERALAMMAERDPITRGLMIKTTNGNAIQNPLVGTANKAMQDMVRYAAEFGFTPAARARVKAEQRGETDNPAAAYFG